MKLSNSKFGGWWLAKIDALKGERKLFSLFANHTQSANRTTGGKLFLTNRRLLFTPHLLDYAMGGWVCEISLSEIISVSVKKADGNLFNGGLGNRLQIDLKNDQTELFKVHNLKQIVLILELQLNSQTNQ